MHALFPIALPLLLHAQPPLPQGGISQDAIGPTLPFTYVSKDLETGGPGHFTLHYALEGEHGIPTPDVDTDSDFQLPSGRTCALTAGDGYGLGNAPDYIERLGCYLEEGLLGLTALGFNGGESPPDIGRVFVVLYDHSGTAVPLNIPLVAGDILLKSTLGDAAAQTVPTHEVFHQLQYTYTTHLEAWWLLEGTAKWSEDCVFDSVNRYRSQMNNYLGDPSVGLFHATYKAVAFWRYISEHYGEAEAGCDVNVSIQRRLWGALGEGLRGPEALNRALAEEGYNATIDSIFGGDFALALLLKDSPQAAPEHQFDENEEAEYRRVWAETTQALAPGEAMAWSGELPAYALSYHHFELESDVRELGVKSTQRRFPEVAYVVFEGEGMAPDIQPMSGMRGEQGIDVPRGADEAWVILGTLSRGGEVGINIAVE